MKQGTDQGWCRVISSAELKGSVTAAALLAGSGVTDFSQLAKSLAVAGVSDFGLTSATALLALSRPSIGALGYQHLDNPPASWTDAALGDVTWSAEHDLGGMSFLRRQAEEPVCAYDEASGRQNRFACRLLITTLATAYMVKFAISANEINKLIVLFLGIGGISSDRIWTLTGKICDSILGAVDI